MRDKGFINQRESIAETEQYKVLALVILVLVQSFLNRRDYISSTMLFAALRALDPSARRARIRLTYLMSPWCVRMTQKVWTYD